MTSRILWIHALSPVHVGCGFGVGAVDLPIVREKATNWPLLPGSGLKGVLADHHNASDPENRTPLARAAFGKPDWREGDQPVSANSGALVIGDARLVLLPVRSLYGTFAWITCPLALRRLARDLSAASLAGTPPLAIPSQTADKLLVPDLPTSRLKKADNRVFLADLDLTAQQDASTKAWSDKIAAWLFPTTGDAWRGILAARLGVVEDDLFNYFLESATEIVTRIHVNPETGTVAKGQLWTEEALPAESVLASLVCVDKVTAPGCGHTEADILKTYCTTEISTQVGGKSTVGRGRVRAVFSAA